MQYQAILDFWFQELTAAQWFSKDVALDAQIRERFTHVHAQAVLGELFDWRSTAQGRLAEIIVLDQLSRNIYRDSPPAFASDAQALALAQTLCQLGLDSQLTEAQRMFAYMPYMHSESLLVHAQAVALYAALGQAETIHFEQKHQEIIKKFGRYPHRNQILGRISTPQEIEFLNTPHSSF